MVEYKHPLHRLLMQRLGEPRRFIQVLAGPRQVGKTTLVRQALETAGIASHYVTADEPLTRDRAWVEQQWQAARRLTAGKGTGKPAVLVLDEIQKVPGWSDLVKFFWDQDSADRLPLHVVVLGSAPLLVQQGLSESLAGRFEVIPVPHWSLSQMRDAFGWDFDRYVCYGGYPGTAPLMGDFQRWRRYVLNSLIETTISRDILQLRRVDKPALLKRLFELGCHYSGQVLSLNKMLGQLQDRGNAATLAHYLEILSGCGLLEGLQKYAGQNVRRRASSPKLQVYNNALLTAINDKDMDAAKEDPSYWGRLIESAVGAWLVNAARTGSVKVYYWQEGNREVDFVLAKADKAVAVEVKSSRPRTAMRGIEAFAAQFPVHKKLLVGGQGIPVKEFLTTEPDEWF